MASQASDSTVFRARTARRLPRTVLGLGLALALTLLGSTAALAASTPPPGATLTPNYVECSSTIGSAFVGSTSFDSYDADGAGFKPVRLTVEGQRLIDAVNGAYCGQVRSHLVIQCLFTRSDCYRMHLDAYMAFQSSSIEGEQTKYVASLHPNATNTIYSSWVSASDLCNWYAMGLYANAPMTAVLC